MNVIFQEIFYYNLEKSEENIPTFRNNNHNKITLFETELVINDK